MSISFGMGLFGALLIIAGWKNVSLSALARGDNTQPKSPVLAGAAAGSSPATTTASSSSSSGYAAGSGSSLH